MFTFDDGCNCDDNSPYMETPICDMGGGKEPYTPYIYPKRDIAHKEWEKIKPMICSPNPDSFELGMMLLEQEEISDCILTFGNVAFKIDPPTIHYASDPKEPAYTRIKVDLQEGLAVNDAPWIGMHDVKIIFEYMVLMEGVIKTRHLGMDRDEYGGLEPMVGEWKYSLELTIETK